MDIRMPQMDGIEAARTLTSEGIAPVLLLTAYSEPDLVQRAAQAGVIGYLVKPFREAQLGPAIEVTMDDGRWTMDGCSFSIVHRPTGTSLAFPCLYGTEH